MQAGGYSELYDSASNSIEEEEDEGHQEEQEWGLTKGMELFEVSAKDDLGGSLNSFRNANQFTYLDHACLAQVYIPYSTT